MKLLPSRRVLCTPFNHAPCHFMQSHVRRVHACFDVTCHLHFWQSGRDLLRATAAILGWNGYRNKSQHRQLTLEKKILPALLQGLEPATFRSRVRRSNHWAIPAPPVSVYVCVCVRACVRACVCVCVCAVMICHVRSMARSSETVSVKQTPTNQNVPTLLFMRQNNQ